MHHAHYVGPLCAKHTPCGRPLTTDEHVGHRLGVPQWGRPQCYGEQRTHPVLWRLAAAHATAVRAGTCCAAALGGVRVRALIPARCAWQEGRAIPRRSNDAARMEVRPLLSNLVVARGYRRRGIAKRLMREAEAHARGWGYRELLLKV